MIETIDLPRLQATASSAQVHAGLSGCGAVIMEGVLSTSELTALNHELGSVFRATTTGEGDFCGRRTKRFSSLLARSPATWRLALHEPSLDAIERILMGPADEPHCDCIQLNLTQAIEIEPGETAQILHRDETMYPGAHPYELMVNVMWTLDDFTEQNGATRLTPGSHLWPKDRIATEGEAVSAVTPAGSAIIWLGSTIHGGGANRSGASRRGVVISYNLGWLAQAERLLLTTPPEVVRRLPERLQRLVGYQVHRPNLGWIESRDPLEWLGHGIDTTLPAQDHFTPPMQERVREYDRSAVREWVEPRV